MAESLADKLIQLSPTQLKSVFDTLDLLIKNPNTIAYAMDDEEPEIENELNRQADEEKYDHEMLAEPPKKKRGRPKKKSEPEVVAQEEVKVTSSRYNSDIQPIVRNQVKTVNAEGKVAATELDIHIGPRPNLFQQQGMEYLEPREDKALAKQLYSKAPVPRRKPASLINVRCGKCGVQKDVSPTEAAMGKAGYTCDSCIVKRKGRK